MNNEILVKTSMANLPMVSEDKLVMDDFFNECHLGYSKECITPIGDLFNTYNMYRNTSGMACYAFQITRTFARWMRTYCPYFQTKAVHRTGESKTITCCNIVMDGMSIDEMREYFASTNVQAPVEQAQLDTTPTTTTTTSEVARPVEPVAPVAPVVVNNAENVANNASNFNRNTTPCMNTYVASEDAKDKASKAVVNEFVNLRLSLKKATIAYGHLVNSLQVLGIDLSQVETIAESMKQEAFASCYSYGGNGYREYKECHDKEQHDAKYANMPNKNKPDYRMNNGNYPQRQQHQQYQQQQYHPTYHAPEYTDDELSEDTNAYKSQQSRINRWYNNWNA